jgi:hypothetical protein
MQRLASGSDGEISATVGIWAPVDEAYDPPSTGAKSI